MSTLALARTITFIRSEKLHSIRTTTQFLKSIRSLSNMADNATSPISANQKGGVAQLILKTPKGMRDIPPAQSWQRKHIFQMITDCFERHGAQPLDTPVCERRELLAGKYGDEAKLIYNLEDQGGEMLSLRYDLTVPFARYLGQNKIQAMTRYHIAKVYRRDNPSITKGRFREFYQCDIDFAGKCDLMMADAECLEILCEILSAVKLPHDFRIKINHRSILNGMFKVAGVPVDKFKPICSSIDKLDKTPWDDVKKEMCSEKGLDEEVADRIGSYVSKSGDYSLIEELMQSELGQNDDCKRGLNEMKTLYKYAGEMGISGHICFDMSLARGLDYYTGLIFEAVILGDVEVGSIAAGGRYDNLVSNLLDNPRFQVPCVGLSVGIERLFAILESQSPSDTDKLSKARVHCYIGSTGKEMSAHRYKMASELRRNGLRIQVWPKDNARPLDLYQACEDKNVPFAIFFGPRDIGKSSICLRTVSERTDDEVQIDSLVDELKKRLDISST